MTREYSQKTDLVTDKVKIALIADLHRTFYGENQQELIEKINAYSPHLILLAGDIVDEDVSRDGTKALLSAIGKEYPCYYVTGNHEFWTNEIETVKNMPSSYAVTVLSGEVCSVTVNGQDLLLGGVDDPAGLYSENETHLPKGDTPQLWQDQFESVCEQNEGGYFSILLSHRPELAKFYEQSGFNLVVSGHAHGGQAIIPFLVNGIYAPHQGLFPKYAGGFYDLGETDMIVSRGLCRDVKPRLFNPPELVFINIEPK